MKFGKKTPRRDKKKKTGFSIMALVIDPARPTNLSTKHNLTTLGIAMAASPNGTKINTKPIKVKMRVAEGASKNDRKPSIWLPKEEHNQVKRPLGRKNYILVKQNAPRTGPDPPVPPSVTAFGGSKAMPKRPGTLPGAQKYFPDGPRNLIFKGLGRFAFEHHFGNVS